MTIEDQLAEGDHVATWGYLTGTHTGLWRGHQRAKGHYLVHKELTDRKRRDSEKLGSVGSGRLAPVAGLFLRVIPHTGLEIDTVANDKDTELEAANEFIRLGSEITGNIARAVAGFLVAGPPGAGAAQATRGTGYRQTNL